MTMRLVHGLIPFHQPRVETGRYLDENSFGLQRSGQAPACRSHWRDNDKILANPATWAVTSSGLMVMHVLDDRIEFEAAILAEVAALRMGFSFGLGANPAATRAAIAGDTRHIPYAEKPLRSVQIQHISYCNPCAFEQEPCRWLGAELEEMAGMLHHIADARALR